MERKKYTFEEFTGIIADLRGEGGCPWDREQTHDSLKPCIMEEAAELTAAVRIYDKTGDAENMREELGDILLQVVMHSQIAEEEGLFTIDDVIDEVGAKMVRRHPHVFGSVKADTADQVLDNWDEIKKKEKEGKSWIESPLREIPRELPALTRAAKVLKKVDKLYERGDDYGEAVRKIEESAGELKRLRPDQDREKLEMVIGDILLSLSGISGQYKIPQEQALTDRIEDLIDKYEPAAVN